MRISWSNSLEKLHPPGEGYPENGIWTYLGLRLIFHLGRGWQHCWWSWSPDLVHRTWSPDLVPRTWLPDLAPGPGHQTLSRWWGASLLGRSCGGRGGHKKKKAPGHRVRGRAPDMQPAYIKLNSDLSESGRSGLQLNISFGEGVGSIAGDPGGGRDGSNKDLPQNTPSPHFGVVVPTNTIQNTPRPRGWPCKAAVTTFARFSSPWLVRGWIRGWRGASI